MKNLVLGLGGVVIGGVGMLALYSLAQSTEYQPLSDIEYDFSNSLSRDNMLTKENRDGLVAKLDHLAENHEMRIRALEGKSTPTVKTYACVGEYELSAKGACMQDVSQTSKVIGRYVDEKARCMYYLDKHVQGENSHHKSDNFSYNQCEMNFPAKYNRSNLMSQDPNTVKMPFDHWGIVESPHKAIIECSSAGGKNSSCSVDCHNRSQYDCNNKKYCTWMEGRKYKKSCSEFSEVACEKHAGCSRKEQ